MTTPAEHSSRVGRNFVVQESGISLRFHRLRSRWNRSIIVRQRVWPAEGLDGRGNMHKRGSLPLFFFCCCCCCFLLALLALPTVVESHHHVVVNGGMNGMAIDVILAIQQHVDKEESDGGYKLVDEEDLM